MDRNPELTTFLNAAGLPGGLAEDAVLVPGGYLTPGKRWKFHRYNGQRFDPPAALSEAHDAVFRLLWPSGEAELALFRDTSAHLTLQQAREDGVPSMSMLGRFKAIFPTASRKSFREARSKCQKRLSSTGASTEQAFQWYQAEDGGGKVELANRRPSRHVYIRVRPLLPTQWLDQMRKIAEQQADLGTRTLRSRSIGQPDQSLLPGLPVAAPLWVGRRTELADLKRRAQADPPPRVILIHGLAGIGKSQLALRLASLADVSRGRPVVHFDMHGSKKRAQVSEEIRRWISLGEWTSSEQAEAGAAGFYADELRANPRLIVLDDVRDGEQLRPLYPPKGSTLIATSRRRISLDVPVETIELAGLQLSDAVALLRQTCTRDIDEHGAVELARALRGHPTCLHIAARRISVLAQRPVADVIEAFKPRRRDIRAQEALQDFLAAVDATLSTRARSALHSLALVPATFSDATAQVLLGEDSAAAVDELMETHLIHGEDGRHALYDLVREWRAAGEPISSGRNVAVLRHFLAMAIALDREYLAGGDRSVRAVATLRLELPNILGCIDRAHGDPATEEIAGSFLEEAGTILTGQVPTAEMIRIRTQALRVAERLVRPRSVADHTCNIGLSLSKSGAPADLEKAIESYDKALSPAQAGSDTFRVATVLKNRGHALRRLGRFEEAEADLHESIRIFESLGDRRHVSGAYRELSVPHFQRAKRRGTPTKEVAEHLAKAREYQDKALELARAEGHVRAEATGLRSLASQALFEGNLEEARSLAVESLHLAEQISDDRGRSFGHQTLAQIERALGDAAAAVLSYRKSVELAKRTGNIATENHSLRYLGELLADSGDGKAELECQRRRAKLIRALDDGRGRSSKELHWVERRIARLTRAKT